jgi:outer membrane lipoprotein LolB
MMRCLFFLGLFLLSGCAQLPPAPAPEARPAHPESASFAMNGRISVNNYGERHSAGLHWTHRGQSDEVLLLTPLGQTAVRVYRNNINATLDDGDKHYQADNADALMEKVLGWHLPLRGLHQWVLGLADTGSPVQIKRDSKDRISELLQNDWEVRYLRYAPDGLPTRLQLSHEHLKVQLLIDEWQWNPN